MAWHIQARIHAAYVCDDLDSARTNGARAGPATYLTEWHVPSVFWFVGCTDPDQYATAKAAGKLSEIPTNHDPRFAPVIHPTIETGVEALVVATRAWLSP